MVEYSLTADSPLSGFRETFESTVLEEAANLGVLSMAIPLGGLAALNKALADAYGATVPVVGKISSSSDGKIRFLGISSDQIFIIFTDAQADIVRAIETTLKGLGYFTLQSDNWVRLRLSGSKSREALARICPIDLDPSIFTDDQVSRTVMEHLGTIIFRDGDDAFILMSASSSATSFLHAVKTSIQNVT